MPRPEPREISCRYGDKCRYFQTNSCKYYHSPHYFTTKRKLPPIGQPSCEKDDAVIRIYRNKKPPFSTFTRTKQILNGRGFKKETIKKVVNEMKACGYNESEILLGDAILKCIEYESEETQKIHLKNWKQWNCLEVIEWIETISNGRFKSNKYRIFKQYLKREKFDGKQLENINDLTLKLLTLSDAKDRQLIVKNVNKLTNRFNRRGNAEGSEIPHEYLDPITFELMSDPVICIKSGYTYDRRTITDQIKANGQDPFTRQKINEQDLIPNRSINDCIEQWKSASCRMELYN